MTREIALHCIKSASELKGELCEECPIYGQTGCDHCFDDALQYVIGMLEQEPCDDAISREELLKAIETWDKFGCDADTKLVRYQDHYVPYIHYDDVIKCIKGMPSVTQKSGKWIETEYHRWRCSVCREKGMSEWDNIHDARTNFCPDCGAKMFEPQESEDKE